MADARADESAIEDSLIVADAGTRAAAEIVAELREVVSRDASPDERRVALSGILARRLGKLEARWDPDAARPFVVAIYGVNGAGKTASVGKLAKRFSDAGKRTMLAAGDTFRAAAREQLEKWAERSGSEIIFGGGDDPASVAFDAVSSGVARGADVVLIDTAGRLPTRTGLMAEAAKISRASGKAMAGAPHESLLALDATTGQNALSQLREFSRAVGVSGTVVTKLDGTAKGGFLLALAAEESPVPVRFVADGEGADDIAPFNAEEYAKALAGV